MTNPATDSRASTADTHRTRVLVVTDDVSTATALIGPLRALSLDLQLSGYDGLTFTDLPERAPSAIVCVLTDYVDASERIVRELRGLYAPRVIPVIGRLSRECGAASAYDSVLFAPVHATQLAHRIHAMIRLGHMEQEILRRMDTMRDDFGQDIALTDDSRAEPFRILFVGKADPAYMAVVNALKDRHVDVVAAFTSFSAFDYLHDRSFDAVVMNALTSEEPAMTISATMRRNSRLYHVPTLFLVDSETFRGRDRAFAAGARDIIDANSPLPEMAGRIIELANYHRLHERLKGEFRGLGGAQCTDPETGVFNADFLSAHLRRVARDCRARRAPLSILTMKLFPAATDRVDVDDLRVAYGKAVELMAGLVRMQDIVARVDIDTVIIAFPEEVRAGVETVLTRMTGLIECAAFERADGSPSPITLRIKAAIVEQEAHESADMLIGNGIRTVDRDGRDISRSA